LGGGTACTAFPSARAKKKYCLSAFAELVFSAAHGGTWAAIDRTYESVAQLENFKTKNSMTTKESVSQNPASDHFIALSALKTALW